MSKESEIKDFFKKGNPEILVTPLDISNLSKERTSKKSLDKANNNLIKNVSEYQKETASKEAIENGGTDSSGASDTTTSKKDTTILEVETLLVGTTQVQNLEQQASNDELSKEDKPDRENDDDER